MEQTTDPLAPFDSPGGAGSWNYYHHHCHPVLLWVTSCSLYCWVAIIFIITIYVHRSCVVYAFHSYHYDDFGSLVELREMLLGKGKKSPHPNAVSKASESQENSPLLDTLLETNIGPPTSASYSDTLLVESMLVSRRVYPVASTPACKFPAADRTPRTKLPHSSPR